MYDGVDVSDAAGIAIEKSGIKVDYIVNNAGVSACLWKFYLDGFEPSESHQHSVLSALMILHLL